MKQYLDQGVVKKPAGFGDPGKISTQTCQVCLQDPKTYNQVESLTAPPVMFEDAKGYSNSPMQIFGFMKNQSKYLDISNCVFTMNCSTDKKFVFWSFIGQDFIYM